MLKDDIQILSRSVFILAERNEPNLLSYWSGYFENRNDEEKKLIKLIGTFLKRKYNIEKKLTTWIEQIDHYSFIKEIEWFDGFYKLLSEIEKNEFEEITKVEEEKSFNFIKVESKCEFLNKIASKGGIEIKKGDVLRLSDKIGIDYKKTKHFNVSIKNPSWELFYPSEKDYKFIRFMHTAEDSKLGKVTYGNVWRVFSNFPTTVQSIEKRNGIDYINTEMFEIEFQNALNAKEFSISSEQNVPNNFSDLIEDLNSSIEYLREGLLTEDEFNLSQFTSSNLLRFNFGWQNYRRHFASNIGRHWCELKK